jgi:RNA polymerase sigma factor (sigma-70 family)
VIRATPRAQASRFAGCVRAFEQEFDFLFRLLRRHGIPPADAEDLVQEVFAVMWRRWSDYRPDRPLRPWLVGIAVRRTHKYLARRRREVPTPALEPAERATSSLDDRVDARTLLRRALARVPETNRSALVLHDLDGMAMAEVARTLSIPVATAYTRVGRARRAFVKAALELQARPRHKAPVVFAPEALLALARASEPASIQTRARALERAGKLAPVSSGELALRPALPAPAMFALSLVAALVVVSAAGQRILAFGERAVALEPTRAAARVPAASIRGRLAGPRDLPRVPALRVSPLPAVHAALGSGLAGYWRFDEGVGSVIAQDLSDARHDCVLRGLDPESAWLDGALGRGVDVHKGWIECPQPPLLVTARTELTVAGWIRTAVAQPGHVALVARQLGEGRDDYFFLGLLDGKLKAFGNLWGLGATAGRPLPLQRWVHVAFTRAADGSTRLYQDGVQVAQSRSQKRPVERSARAAPRLTIGSGMNGPGEGQRVQQFSGAIDEVAVYERALGADQIAALAAGAQPPSAR